MKRSIITILLCGFVFACFGQNSSDSVPSKKSPNIYVDFHGGYVVGKTQGFGYGASINYQNKKDLFTLRSTYVFDFDELFANVTTLGDGESINEFAFLYGKRYINNLSSYSVSIGLSTTLWKYIENNDLNSKQRIHYIGLPFEANFNSFKNKSEKFDLLIGAKIYGNIGKTWFLGLGVNFGFGWHKRQ